MMLLNPKPHKRSDAIKAEMDKLLHAGLSQTLYSHSIQELSDLISALIDAKIEEKS